MTARLATAHQAAEAAQVAAAQAGQVAAGTGGPGGRGYGRRPGRLRDDDAAATRDQSPGEGPRDRAPRRGTRAQGAGAGGQGRRTPAGADARDRDPDDGWPRGDVERRAVPCCAACPARSSGPASGGRTAQERGPAAPGHRGFGTWPHRDIAASPIVPHPSPPAASPAPRRAAVSRRSQPPTIPRGTARQGSTRPAAGPPRLPKSCVEWCCLGPRGVVSDPADPS